MFELVRARWHDGGGGERHQVSPVFRIEFELIDLHFCVCVDSKLELVAWTRNRKNEDSRPSLPLFLRPQHALFNLCPLPLLVPLLVFLPFLRLPSLEGHLDPVLIQRDL